MSLSSSAMSTSVLELKGSLLTLMVLRLLDSDKHKITIQLAEKIAQAPDFFNHAPIIIDLQTLSEHNNDLDLPYLIHLVKTHGLMPVAVRGGNEHYHQVAVEHGLGLLPNVTTKPLRTRADKTTSNTMTATGSVTKVVTQPIRSGQQVVALQGDLVILSTVSPGAEILAQRHIHVYGTLRGRALAGVNGDEEARIFCQSFDAELVSIAGHYQVNEQLDENMRGKPTQIYLEEGKLKIQTLDTVPR